VAIALVDDSYESDDDERIDQVEGDFMDGDIVGNELVFLCRGKHAFTFAIAAQAAWWSRVLQPNGELRRRSISDERNPGAGRMPVRSSLAGDAKGRACPALNCAPWAHRLGGRLPLNGLIQAKKAEKQLCPKMMSRG
jgi:hypothetical protein